MQRANAPFLLRSPTLYIFAFTPYATWPSPSLCNQYIYPKPENHRSLLCCHYLIFIPML